MSDKILYSHKLQALAFLVLRIGVGLSFIYHGSGKIIAPGKWEWLGSQMPILNFDSLNMFWGFMASFSEFFGGIFLVCGFLIRPSAFLLMITMFVAARYHYLKNESIELCLVYLVCCFILFLAGKEDSTQNKKFQKPIFSKS